MIVLDIETSGLYPERHGIWQIGALDFYNPQNTFLKEGRIDEEDEIVGEALKVIGKTEGELRDPNKQSQKQLIQNFFDWTKTVKIRNALCQNPQFDLGFLNYKARKYNIISPLHHRSFDLHSIAQAKYEQIENYFLIKDDHSEMGLSNILKFVGLEDNRKGHNALEDGKLTGECFSRLVYHKSLFEEFSQYKIPEYLAR